MMPGIAWNWRRTSSTIEPAARPTAFIVIAQKRNAAIPPMKRPPSSIGFMMFSCCQSTKLRMVILLAAATSIPSPRPESNLPIQILLSSMKLASSAIAVSAAEPIANPLPVAAVVLPSESSASVRWRTSGGRPDISALPPALSAIGP